MRLDLSQRADADLDETRDFSVGRFGTARTLVYLDAVEQALRRIIAYPQIGMLMSELRPGLRSLPCGEHRVFYAHDVDRVLILRILHKQMDAERHL